MDDFQALLDANYAKVFYYTFKRVKNNHDAADITQNTILKAFLHYKAVRNPSSLAPWLFRICNNEISQYYRVREKPSPLTEELPAPEESANYDELHTAIDYLPQAQRQVVLLKYFGGYSMQEIALLLALSTATVKSRLYEARQNLKLRLNEIDLLPNLQKERRDAIMAILKLCEIGAKTIPCMSLHGQKQLLHCAKENSKFGTVVLSELANIPTGQEFMDITKGKLSYDELLRILACCDDASLYRLSDGNFKTWRNSAKNPLLKDIAAIFKSSGYVDSVEQIMYVPSMKDTIAWYKKYLNWGAGDDAEGIEQWQHAIITPYSMEGDLHTFQNFKGFHLRHSDSNANKPYSCNAFIFVSDVEEMRQSIVDEGWDNLTQISSYAWGTKGFCLTDLNGFVLEICEWEC
ncbi:MAG: sigma-70 family RNA polymerase sigma factor [Defluviitaleaceae bacterium]|nr:sigma-70 family RNA polymerase sigma factor [Defluviitaleaceae bacterium]